MEGVGVCVCMCTCKLIIYGDRNVDNFNLRSVGDFS